jgi:hypothetical protein
MVVVVVVVLGTFVNTNKTSLRRRKQQKWNYLGQGWALVLELGPRSYLRQRQIHQEPGWVLGIMG